VRNRIALFSFLIPDYDEAIGFDLNEDTDLGDEKNAAAASRHPARTPISCSHAPPTQSNRQTGQGSRLAVPRNSRVQHRSRPYRSRRRSLRRSIRVEPYGRVAVWADLWGNRWDVIQFANPDRSGTAA